MNEINKKELSEMDIRTKYITPAIVSAGWSSFSQMREEYKVTNGRIIARGKTCKREAPLKADYVLFYKPNKPIAIVEAKDNNHTMADGMQQALQYADMMDVPFVFSSNGDGFVFHNKFITEGHPEINLSLDEFPSPETLWNMYHEQSHVSLAQDTVIDEPYYSDNPDKQPRYYQMNAINKTVEAIANGQNRVLLVMATGTGKTYTAFQIIWRLWKAGIKKRILTIAYSIHRTARNLNGSYGDSATLSTGGGYLLSIKVGTEPCALKASGLPKQPLRSAFLKTKANITSMTNGTLIYRIRQSKHPLSD